MDKALKSLRLKPECAEKTQFITRQPPQSRLFWDAMTNSLPKPEVIITHESDLDGLVAGVLLQRLAQALFNFVPPLEAYHYNNWKQRDLREKSAWVTDLSFEARLDRPNWAVIDHHVTEVAPKNALLIHDIGK